MPNYQNGKIYMIESLEGKCRYYGSTVQKLSVRIGEHRSAYKKKLNKFTSSNVLCFNDAKILLVEKYPCNSKEELNRKEGEYIRNNDCVNKNTPGRTSKEYYIDNKEIILNRVKKYSKENKEKIQQKKKQYREKNKEKIKQHREQNKENRKKRDSEIIICECGLNIKRGNKARHKRTKKHMKLMEKNNL